MVLLLIHNLVYFRQAYEVGSTAIATLRTEELPIFRATGAKDCMGPLG